MKRGGAASTEGTGCWARHGTRGEGACTLAPGPEPSISPTHFATPWALGPLVKAGGGRAGDLAFAPHPGIQTDLGTKPLQMGLHLPFNADQAFELVQKDVVTFIPRLSQTPDIFLHLSQLWNEHLHTLVGQLLDLLGQRLNYDFFCGISSTSLCTCSTNS